MDGTVVTHYREGDYDCTKTSYFLLEREGEMAFRNIPVDASTKMDNDLMDSVEPFDFNELRDYSGAYLAGYLADRFDSGPDHELNRASDRARRSAFEAFQATCAGYMTKLRSTNLKLQDPSVKYVLLPIYLLTCSYKGKDYRYAINGQTGKVVGELPVSKGKCWMYFGIAFAITFLLIFLGSFLVM